MSRNSAGTYSLPAGNPVIVDTIVDAAWWNNTSADMALELTGSLDRNGRGPMLAPLALVDGSTSAPALTFGSEPTTGLYRAGAGDVRLQVLGTELAKLKSDGTAEFASPLVGASGLGFTMPNPGVATAFQNKVTPKNITKAWATLLTNGSGAVSVLEGFCIASAVISGASIRVTFAQPFTNANYLVGVTLPVQLAIDLIGPAGNSGGPNKATTTCDLSWTRLVGTTATSMSFATNAREIYVSFTGAQ